MAAVQATGELEPLSVPAPPLAGAPAAGSLFGGPLLSGGSSGGLPWEVPSTLSGVCYAASVFGGAHTAVHDLASGREGRCAPARPSASAGSLPRSFARPEASAGTWHR